MLFQFVELKSEFKLANCILIVPMCSFQRITDSFGRVSCFEDSLRSLRFYGGHKAVVRPDPIPNSAVKHSVADGSGFIDSARVGSRHSLLKKPKLTFRLFLCPSLTPADCRQTSGRNVSPTFARRGMRGLICRDLQKIRASGRPHKFVPLTPAAGAGPAVAPARQGRAAGLGPARAAGVAAAVAIPIAPATPLAPPRVA